MTHSRHVRTSCAVTGLLLAYTITVDPCTAQTPQQLDQSRDRGPGIPVSMFGTYIDRGEVFVYTFVEYYRDRNAEYSPQELGFGLDQDFRGRYRATEGLVFIGYGVSDRLAIELEAAVISARLETSPDDPTAVPAVIEESGLGDVEGQVRWRWARETERRPEFFTYFETVFPLQRDRLLIGTRDWELKLGGGMIRSFAWGTMTVRLAVEYDAAEKGVEPGEFALEYLKRISPAVRVYLGVEGTQDEIELIPELQLSLRRNVVLKLNSAIGMTSKATDWAPELGILFAFR